VIVPAGTFTALRLESSPGTNNATSTTFWYSPEARVMVKRIYERTTDHYLGYGKFTTELVRYERPVGRRPNSAFHLTAGLVFARAAPQVNAERSADAA